MSFYSLDGKTGSIFTSGSLVTTSELLEDKKSNKYILDAKEQWSKILGEINKGLYYKIGEEPKQREFYRKGIVYEFAKLKTEKNIHEFASKYGLLGITPPQNDEKVIQHILDDVDIFGIGTVIERMAKKGSNFEPIEVWWTLIKKIQDNLKLYQALVSIHRGNEVEIEDNLLKVSSTPVSLWKDYKYYPVLWYNDEFTSTAIEAADLDKMDFVDIGRLVLIENIQLQAYETTRPTHVDIVNTNKPPLGFTLVESKIATNLITAIYYDLWQMISENKPVHICQNPNCKLPFEKIKRQQYCTNACKQEAYRIRKKTR